MGELGHPTGNVAPAHPVVLATGNRGVYERLVRHVLPGNRRIGQRYARVLRRNEPVGPRGDARRCRDRLLKVPAQLDRLGLISVDSMVPVAGIVVGLGQPLLTRLRMQLGKHRLRGWTRVHWRDRDRVQGHRQTSSQFRRHSRSPGTGRDWRIRNRLGVEPAKRSMRKSAISRVSFRCGVDRGK